MVPLIIIILLLCCFIHFEMNFFNLFIYWLHWVFVAAYGLSLVAVSRGCFSLQCTGFSLRQLLLLQSTGSRHTGFTSCSSRGSSGCSSQALVAHGMWDLPRPQIEPVSPALEGGCLFTVPPGKSLEKQF